MEKTTLVDKARHCNGALLLPVSSISASAGIFSPYFQTKDPRRIGTGRDTTISDHMKAVLLSYTYISGPTVAALVGFQSGTSYVEEAIIPLTGFDFDSGNLATQTQSVILAYAVSKSYSITASDIEGVAMSVAVPVESSLSLSLQTSTGAVGTQVSATKDAWVTITGTVTTTASIAGNAVGSIFVEVAPTNSATAGDWVEKGRIGNSQALSLAITLQSVQAASGSVAAFVPAGYYVKARTSGSGTVSYAINEARQLV